MVVSLSNGNMTKYATKNSFKFQDNIFKRNIVIELPMNEQCEYEKKNQLFFVKVLTKTLLAVLVIVIQVVLLVISEFMSIYITVSSQ